MMALPSTALTLIALIHGLVSLTSGARILCLFPVPSKSHLVVFSALTTELANRGHELVVVSPFPLKKAPANYTDIDTMPSIREFYEEIMSLELYDLPDMPFYLIPFMYWYHGGQGIEGTLKDPQVLKLLDDPRGFDLVVCEDFLSEALYGFAEYFHAPLVLISSMGGLHWISYEMGFPLEPAYVPNGMLTFSDHMSLSERMVNAAFSAFWDLGNLLYYLPRQEALRQQVFGDRTSSVWDLRYSASLLLVNSHVSLNFPRPLPPAVIEVGAMHVQPAPRKLPADIQKFLDEAKHGVIYFSMGTNLRGDAMPAEQRDALLKTFSELPQRVLMKWESDTMPGKPDNVMLGKWLPQQDILAHPHVQAFVTHGGLLSAQEAIYHGVPLVGIPVFGDQMLNMRKAELGGYGVLLALRNISRNSVRWALDKALHDPGIRREAQRRSAVLRDQPQTPLERAVFWVEYVLRHKGAPHLRSAALHLAWYQLYMFDLLALVLVPLVMLLLIAYALVRRLLRPTPVPTSNKKKRQ